MVRYNLETGHPRQLFVRPDGDNTLDGRTWGSAKQTLAAAYATTESFLADGYSGSVIWLSRGKHQVNGFATSSGHPPKIIGMGPASTKVIVDAADAVGMTIDADGTVLRDFEVRDEVSAGHAGGGILISDAQDCTLDSVWWDEIADGDTVGQPFDTRPYALKVTGGGSFADWNKFTNLRVRACLSAILIDGGTNGFWSNVDTFGSDGQDTVIHVRKKTQPSGQNDSHHYWTNVWLAGGPYGADGYQIVLESIDTGTASKWTGQSFVNLNLELSSAARGRHFIKCNGRANFFDKVRFTGGGWTDGTHAAGSGVQPDAIFFGTDAETSNGGQNNVVGMYQVVDNNGPPRFRATATTNAVIWQPSDFTGAPVVA